MRRTISNSLAGAIAVIYGGDADFEASSLTRIDA
jgi:hypothetical protein